MARCAIVLAAGQGERLWPLTSTRPKPLLPLPRGTLLSNVLASLRDLVENVVVVIGHLGEMVKEYIEGHGWGFQVFTAIQEKPHGTADAVRAGIKELPRSCDEVLIVYGDLYYGAELPKLLVEKGVNAFVLVETSEAWRYGVASLHGNCLKRVIEKPPKGQEPSNLVNAGVYLLERTVLEEALNETPLSPRGEYELTDTLNIIASRRCIRPMVYHGPWMDVGTPWDYMSLVQNLAAKLIGGKQVIEGEIEPGARLNGPVYIASNAVVRTGTVVEGPAWIEGEIGPSAHVRPYTIVYQGAKIGAFTQAKASILLENAKAPHLNYVGDSVLGEDSNMGAGSVTANLRFDHATIKVMLKGELVDTGRKKLGAIIGGHAQIGVNASLMPGIRVGAYSWIEPGIRLNEDVPDCSFAKERNGKIIMTPLKDFECKPPMSPPRRY